VLASGAILNLDHVVAIIPAASTEKGDEPWTVHTTQGGKFSFSDASMTELRELLMPKSFMPPMTLQSMAPQATAAIPE
jgi:hypothetical protein